MDVPELGIRVRAERRRRGLTLDDLARASGVSRSMVSEVERGTRVPTVLTLDRIATGLGTSIARLLRDETATRRVVLRHEEQSRVVDADGWERRVLSPVLPGVEFEFMRTTLGPRVDAGTFLPHSPGSREYLAVEAGTLRLTLDGDPVELYAGDSIYYAGDGHHGFANPGRARCVFYLAMDVTGSHVTESSVAGTEAASSEPGETRGAAPERIAPVRTAPGRMAAGRAVPQRTTESHVEGRR